MNDKYKTAKCRSTVTVKIITWTPSWNASSSNLWPKSISEGVIFLASWPFSPLLTSPRITKSKMDKAWLVVYQQRQNSQVITDFDIELNTKIKWVARDNLFSYITYFIVWLNICYLKENTIPISTKSFRQMTTGTFVFTTLRVGEMVLKSDSTYR